MTLYRISRTIVSGQYANDSCFTVWIAAQAGAAQFIKMVEDPINKIADQTGEYVPSTVGQAIFAALAPPIYLGGQLIKAAANAAADVKDLPEHRYYLWLQNAEVPKPKCPNSDPDFFVTYQGKNGWATEAEANAALNAQIKVSQQVVAEVQAANDAEMSGAHFAKQVLKDAADAADKAAKVPWLWIGAGVVAAVLAIKTLK